MEHKKYSLIEALLDDPKATYSLQPKTNKKHIWVVRKIVVAANASTRDIYFRAGLANYN